MSDKENESKISRVIFEYDNGTKKSISDAQLNKWIEFNKHVCTFARTHGQNPPWHEIKWVDE